MLKNSKKFLFALGVVSSMFPLGETFAAGKTSKTLEPVVLLVRIPLKKETFSEFLPIMQNNVKASRKEPGNISFHAYQPEDNSPELILVERWKSQSALDIHNDTLHLGAVKTAFQKDALEGQDMDITKLVEISPVAQKKTKDIENSTHNVVVILHAKPESRDILKKTLLNVVQISRAALGNLQFDVFENQADPNNFVLVERWVNSAMHEAHFAQSYNQPLKDLLEASLTQPLSSGRFLLKDISQ